MIKFFHKKTALSEYSSKEMGSFYISTYYYLGQTLSDNREAVLHGIKPFDSAETKILKYFAETTALFQILDENPKYIRKIHELDYMALQKFGVQHYAIYADSLTEDETFTIRIPNSTFIKRFNINCLYPSQQYFPIMLDESINPPAGITLTLQEQKDNAEDLKVLPNLIEKLNKDLQKIQEFKASN